MQSPRSKAWRQTAGFVTRSGVIVLFLAGAWSARALDAGDGSDLSLQQIRKPAAAGATDRVLSVESLRKGPAGEKAELSVYQVYGMHFGTLCDNDGYVVLGTADAIIQDPDHLFYGGSPQSAEIRFSGDAYRAFGVSVVGGSATGFTLSDFATDYGTPPLSGLTLDSGGLLTLRVGARLQLSAASVAEGNGQEIGYTVSAVYE